MFFTCHLSSKVYILRKGYHFTICPLLFLLIAIGILFKQNPKPYSQNGLVQIRLGKGIEEKEQKLALNITRQFQFLFDATSFPPKKLR